MSEAFMITFDLLDPTADLDAFKEFVKTSKLFKDWWNHIPGIFLVTSESDAATISTEVKRYTKNARLLVVKVELTKSEGMLPKGAWEWIYDRAEPRESITTAAGV